MPQPSACDLPPALMTPEFRLLAACMVWPPTEQSRARIRQYGAMTRDWPFFQRLVARHRVGGFVAMALSACEKDIVPADIRADLSQQGAANLRLSLMQLAEATRLNQQLAQAGIDATFLKGQTLAALAYGDAGVGIRHSRDIDFLVAPEAVDSALAILIADGYQPDDPLHLRPQFRRSRTVYHLTLSNPHQSMKVELHWRLTQNRHLMPVGHSLQSRQIVPLAGGTQLPTLSRQDLFLYLCVHGARHAWFRLKWLADIAAMAARMDEPELNSLLAAARSRGLTRPVAQGLVLSARLLELNLPGDMATRLAQGRSMGLLLRVATAALADTNEYGSDHHAPVANLALPTLLRQRASGYLLRGSIRFWLTEMAAEAVNHHDWQTIRLPPYLMALYPLLRLPLWLLRRARRHYRQTQ